MLKQSKNWPGVQYPLKFKLPIFGKIGAHFYVGKIIYWVGNFEQWAGWIYWVGKLIYWVGTS